MRAATKLTLTLALAGLIGGAAAVTTDAAAQTGMNVIRLTVSLKSVRVHSTGVGPKGISPGDGFQESWVPSHRGLARRQDAIAIATFRQGIFLGTITFQHGQIIYAASTNDQDNAVFAIVGGTGSYQGARGTVTTQSLPHGQLQITIATTT